MPIYIVYLWITITCVIENCIHSKSLLSFYYSGTDSIMAITTRAGGLAAVPPLFKKPQDEGWLEISLDNGGGEAVGNKMHNLERLKKGGKDTVRRVKISLIIFFHFLNIFAVDALLRPNFSFCPLVTAVIKPQGCGE